MRRDNDTIDGLHAKHLLHLHRLEEEYVKLEANRLINLMGSDPDGRLLLITTTFPGRRFVADSWSCGDARRAMRLIERASDDLHRAFRGFYLKTLASSVEDFRHRNDLQPIVVAFVDDRQEGDLERYPHIHSVWFVPSGVVEPVRAWLVSVDAARAWADLSEGGSIHVEDVDPGPESVRRVVAYAGKLLTGAAAAGVATQALCRTLPRPNPREASKALQRPRQPHDEATVERRRHRPRRRGHRHRQAAAPFTVMRLRSRRAG